MFKQHVSRSYILLFTGIFALLCACENPAIHSNETLEQNKTLSADYSEGKNAKMETGGFEEGVYSEQLAEINNQLAEKDIDNIQLAMAETITYTNDGELQAGQTLFANDRAKQLGSQWMPNDERRNATGNDLTYTVFSPLAIANGAINSESDIDASFETWNNLKETSGPDINKIPTPAGIFPSAILSFPLLENDPFAADISTIGFLPGTIFDSVLGPGSSSSVLGVTFTFTWVAEPEVVALKEVWYNDDFAWSDNGTPGTIDIESVALHENGHALGFGHFGKLSVTNANGKIHVSPRAVMNASYLAPQRELLGTDKASFNSVYGKWPND